MIAPEDISDELMQVQETIGMCADNIGKDAPVVANSLRVCAQRLTDIIEDMPAFREPDDGTEDGEKTLHRMIILYDHEGIFKDGEYAEVDEEAMLKEEVSEAIAERDRTRLTNAGVLAEIKCLRELYDAEREENKRLLRLHALYENRQARELNEHQEGG